MKIAFEYKHDVIEIKAKNYRLALRKLRDEIDKRHK